MYGFRGGPSGFSRNVYYLNAWEFLMLWECTPLPKPEEKAESSGSRNINAGERYVARGRNSKGVPICTSFPDGGYGPNLAAEDDDVLFFHEAIPGPAKLHQRWYMRRRRRPMVPAPSNAPLPESMKDAEGKSQLYLVYMRPWTLLRE